MPMPKVGEMTVGEKTKPTIPASMFRFPERAAEIGALTKSVSSKIAFERDSQGIGVSISFGDFKWYVLSDPSTSAYKAYKTPGRSGRKYNSKYATLLNNKKSRYKGNSPDKAGITPIDETKQVIPCSKIDEALFLCIAKWNEENPKDKIVKLGSLVDIAAAYIPGLDMDVKTNSFRDDKKNATSKQIDIPLRKLGIHHKVFSRIFSGIPRGRDKRNDSDSSIDSIPTGGDSPKISPRRLKQ